VDWKLLKNINYNHTDIYNKNSLLKIFILSREFLFYDL